MVYRGFLGTYAQGEEGFLWRFWLDGETGALSGAAPALRAADCKYLSLEGGVLAMEGNPSKIHLKVVSANEMESRIDGTGSPHKLSRCK